MDKRREVQITIFNQEQYDDEWIPDKLVDAIAWLTGKLEEIPEEFRAIAEIEVDSESGYEGSHYGHIEITYRRPETDEEMATRLAEEKRCANARERDEMETLRRLKLKYGEQ